MTIRFSAFNKETFDSDKYTATVSKNVYYLYMGVRKETMANAQLSLDATALFQDRFDNFGDSKFYTYYGLIKPKAKTFTFDLKTAYDSSIGLVKITK